MPTYAKDMALTYFELKFADYRLLNSLQKTTLVGVSHSTMIQLQSSSTPDTLKLGRIRMTAVWTMHD